MFTPFKPEKLFKWLPKLRCLLLLLNTAELLLMKFGENMNHESVLLINN